jgi:hypothetical protein
MSVASLAGYLNNGGGGGGNVNNIIQGDGITVTDNGYGDYTIANNGVIYGINGAGIDLNLVADGGLTITNTGVTSIIAGDGININNNTGEVIITSTVNPTDYLTTTDAASTYQTQANMADYSTTAEANALYQTQTDMGNYSTTVEANTLYQPIFTYTPYLYQRVFNGNIAIAAGQNYNFDKPETGEIVTDFPYNPNSLYQITVISGDNSPPVTLVSYTTEINGSGSINTKFATMLFYNSSSTETAYIHTISVFGMVPNV